MSSSSWKSDPSGYFKYVVGQMKLGDRLESSHTGWYVDYISDGKNSDYEIYVEDSLEISYRRLDSVVSYLSSNDCPRDFKLVDGGCIHRMNTPTSGYDELLGFWPAYDSAIEKSGQYDVGYFMYYVVLAKNVFLSSCRFVIQSGQALWFKIVGGGYVDMNDVD